MARDLRLELFTADEGYGHQLMLADDTFKWEGDYPERETTSAKFTEIHADGSKGAAFEIDGNTWRDLESSGRFDELVETYQNGVELADCLRRFDVEATGSTT
jgi:hypothetical protein